MAAFLGLARIGPSLPASNRRRRMLPKLLTSIFGSRNDRLLKQYRNVVARDQRARTEVRGAQRRGAAGQDGRIPPARGQRRNAGPAAARGLRDGARGQQARAEDAPFRCPADGRHGAARRQDRRDAHRRGQDPDGDAAGLPEFAQRPRRPPGDGQRLPRAARRRVDGPALPVPRHERRRQPGADVARGKAGGLRRRRDLRHQQRVRLRLPARQHGAGRRRPRRPRPGLRDRRRGRLDPDRRGAHAADHQRPGRRPHRDVRAHQRDRAEAEEADRRARPAHRRRRDRSGRLHGRREDASGLPDRGRPRERRAAAGRSRLAARRREPVRRGQHRADAPRLRGAACTAAVQARPALRRAGRRGRHRRRIHRPPDERPALVRRPAPGGRGQGRRADPEREPDARVDHLPELLPHVRQARPG